MDQFIVDTFNSFKMNHKWTVQGCMMILPHRICLSHSMWLNLQYGPLLAPDSSIHIHNAFIDRNSLINRFPNPLCIVTGVKALSYPSHFDCVPLLRFPFCWFHSVYFFINNRYSRLPQLVTQYFWSNDGIKLRNTVFQLHALNMTQLYFCSRLTKSISTDFS